jgi:hypothetical protein
MEDNKAVCRQNSRVQQMEASVPVIHLRYFSLSSQRALAATTSVPPLMISAAKLKFFFLILFSYRHSKMLSDLTHTEETNNCCYAFRGYEMAKLFL